MKDHKNLMRGFTISNPAKKIKDDLTKNIKTKYLLFDEFETFKKWDLSLPDEDYDLINQGYSSCAWKWPNILFISLIDSIIFNVIVKLFKDIISVFNNSCSI